MTREEYETKYGKKPDFSTATFAGKSSNPSASQPASPGLMSRIGSDFKERGQKLVDSAASTRQNINDAGGGFGANLAGIGQMTGNLVGQIAGGVLNAGGQAIKSGINTINQDSGQTFDAGVQKLMDSKVLGGPTVKDLVSHVGEFMKRGTDALPKNVTESYQNFLNTIGLMGGGKVLNAPVDEIVSKGKNIVTKTVDGVKSFSNKVESAVQPVKDMTTGIGQGAARIPARIATNVAEKQAQQQAIRSLPRQSMRNAANEGINVNDLKGLAQIPRNERAPLKKLAEVTKDWASGKTKVSPESVVGKPIVNRLKTLTNQVKGYGTQLDKVAEMLKGKAVKAKDAVIRTIDGTLDSIGIKQGKDGLDFKGSNLEGLGANEKIISNVYRRLTEATDASDFHRLKRYIDNSVDFGKRGEGFTGEAGRLLKEWRRAIDSALDSEFPAYNKVNTALSERIGPLDDLRDALKGVDGADVDLLEMGAGLLARRITSTAVSNPKIRQILRNLDKFTAIKGKTSLSVERLQDFYNILDKYYDIARKTGFQGQVASGVEKASSVQGYLMDKARDLAGSTNAVRQKALEGVLEDLFNPK